MANSFYCNKLVDNLHSNKVFDRFYCSVVQIFIRTIILDSLHRQYRLFFDSQNYSIVRPSLVLIISIYNDRGVQVFSLQGRGNKLQLAFDFVCLNRQ